MNTQVAIRNRRLALRAATVLIAALLLGGAIAVGSGWVPMSQVVPPTPDAALITLPTSPPPSTSPSVSSSQTPGLAPSGIGSGSWLVASPPHHGGCCNTATLLRDGRVLITGLAAEDGTQTGKAELFDPATGRWTKTGSMHVARSGHVASLLADGRVLVAGGVDSGKGYMGALASAELYDPTSGTWAETGSMTRWRISSKAISLADGRVLVLGGRISGRDGSSHRIPPGGGGDTKGAETYDPESGTWSSARPMTAPPDTATLLPDGTVLVTHDNGGSSELFDPRTGRWTAMASSPQPLYSPRATLLANGEVLLLAMWDRPLQGGGCPCEHFVGGAELYDPLTGSWTPTGNPPTGWGTAALLAEGIAFVFGADGAVRYDQRSGSWTTVAAPPHEFLTTNGDGSAPSYLALSGTPIRLVDGRVLAVGEPGAALFDPNGTP